MNKITLIAVFLGAFYVSAQDVDCSQFWNNGVQYNPAMTGVIPANLRVASFYRNQWSSVGSTYNTFGLNADTRIETKGNTSFGLGVNVYRDVAGDLKQGTTNAQLSFSTIVSLDGKSKLSLGLNGGMIQKGMDQSGAQWNSQYTSGSYDGTLPYGETFNSLSEIKGDVSAGIVYYYSTSETAMTLNDRFNMKIGFSCNHIIRPKFNWHVVAPDAMYRNFVAHAEFLIGIQNSKWSILPAVIAQFQGPSKEILCGSQFRFELKKASRITGFVKGVYLNIGTFIRLGDAFIPSVTLEFDRYSIGASYDVNTSPLRAASNFSGGFEISLKFRTPNPYLWQGSNISRSKIR